ncbi:helix-turn-helix transcriptional regulator [Legionella cardiaca]|uniref:Helix-turn-helix transcriptional regulator n=1 Tax=Legionella cardiaca TaxID=1071983 RepID=A0ABY8AS11_9GAMM|nr:helix-turn-helix transcriptional regulator [Legionella cardiaca]WED43244.1 helix-turn-helix transcriptional regulator [Legionella cardiaca]
MNNISNTLSLACKKQIDEVCKPMANIDLKYLVMYLIFNDGRLLILSNIPPLVQRYYQENLYKQDYSYTYKMIEAAYEGYYLCNEVEFSSPEFKKILKEKYNIYPIYNIVRRCAECTFVFSAIRGAPVKSDQLFYKKTIRSFENFCANFVDAFLEVIIYRHPKYRYSFILTNQTYRHAIIKGGYAESETISMREQECLWLSAQGKTVKQIAQILKISPYTVEKYLKNIREAFNCHTLIEAVIEGIHRGMIGRVNINKKIISSDTK